MQTRCPHCQCAIELASDTSLDEVKCATCGSSFSLVGQEDTLDWTHGSQRRIAHFELSEQLGRGTFGTVWRARDTRLDREVAIKIPRKGQLTPEESEKFLREARAAAQLNHPGIVGVHEVGRESDTVFIVSDLVEGVTLTDWLSAHRPSPCEAADMAARIADALHHAHENGVTHRDLKPGNLMTDRQGNLHLMDFGLAKRDMGEVTMTIDGQVLGTPAYLSPEAARGDAHIADARSDIYALGVILFEMLTGERPFRGNARMLIHQLLTEEAPSPRKLVGSIPRDLETISIKCLRREPEKRYASARDLAADLRRWRDGKPIQARPVSSVEKAWLWCRRHRLIASLSALVVMGLLGTTISLILAANVARRQRDELYRSRVNLTFEAWESGDQNRFSSLMNQLSDSSTTQSKGIEWELLNHHWERYGDIDDRTISTTSPVTSLSYDEHDNLVVGFADKNVATYDLATGESSLWADQAAGDYAVLSSDGSFLATTVETPAAPNKSLIWDSTSRELVPWCESIPSMTFVDFSRSNRQVAISIPSDRIEIRNVQSGDLIQTIDGSLASFLNEDSKIAVLQTESNVNRISIWDTESNTQISNSKPFRIKVGRNFQVSPDGQWIVAGGHDGARIWKILPDEIIQVDWQLATEVYSIAFSSQGYVALGCSDQTVKVWTLNDNPKRLANLMHSSTVTSVAFSSKGETLVAGTRSNKIYEWDTAAWIDPPITASDSFFHPPIAVSSTGLVAYTVLIEGVDQAVVLDLTGGTSRLLKRKGDKTIRALAISPNRKQLAIGGVDSFIEIVDLDSIDGELFAELKVEDGVWCLEFAPDGSLGAGTVGKAIVWSQDFGAKKEYSGPPQVMCLEFSAQGVLAFGGGETDNLNGTLVVFDSIDRDTFLEYACPETVRDVAFSLDGAMLAYTSSFSSGMFGILNTATGSPVPLEAHSGKSTQVAFVGSRLLTGSDNGRVRIWDIERKLPLGTISIDGKVRNIAVWPDQTGFVTVTRRGWVQIWGRRFGGESDPTVVQEIAVPTSY